MKQATASLTIGGHHVVLTGSTHALRAFASAPDFATEQVLRTSGATVARKAFQELHNLMGDDRLTTAQKNHVAEAISSLKKIGPLKSEAGVAVALAKAPMIGAAQMLKILTSIRDDADNEAQRKRMDNAIAVLKKNNPGLAHASVAQAAEPEEEDDYEEPNHVEIKLVDDVHSGHAAKIWSVPKAKRSEAVREISTLVKSLQTGRIPDRPSVSALLRAGRSGKR